MFLKKIVLALMAFIVFSLPGGIGGFGGVSLGGFGLLSMIGILAFLAAVAFLLFGRRGLGQAPVPWDPSLTLFGAFVVLNFASVGWAGNTSAAINSATTYAQLLVFIWLLLFLRSEKSAFSILLHAYLLGAFVVLVQTASVYGFSGLLELNSRLAGVGRTANGFAFVLVLAMPIAFYLFQQGSTRLRWLYLAYVPAAGFLVFLSASRTGFVLMVAVLLVGFLSLIRVEHRGRLRISTKAVAFSVVIAVAMAILIAPQLSGQFQRQVDRIATVTQDETAGGRVHLWVSAIRVYLDNPILGVGSGGARTATAEYRAPEGLIVSLEARRIAPHNTYLGIAVETGTFGLLLYLAALGMVVLRLPNLPRNDRLMFFSMVGVTLIAATTLSLESRREFYFALFLPLAVAALSPQNRRTHRPGALRPPERVKPHVTAGIRNR